MANRIKSITVEIGGDTTKLSKALEGEMCLELIEHITLDAYVEGQPRDIYIYYKLLDKPLKDKRSLF